MISGGRGLFFFRGRGLFQDLRLRKEGSNIALSACSVGRDVLRTGSPTYHPRGLGV